MRRRWPMECDWAPMGCWEKTDCTGSRSLVPPRLPRRQFMPTNLCLPGDTVLADAAEEANSLAEAERSLNEPVLTADELRALLQEQTYSPDDEQA